MINLLPPATKSELKAGRVNTLLVRYLTALGVTAGLIVVVFGVSYFLNERNKADYTALKQASEQQLGELGNVRTKVEQFNNNIKSVKTLYASQILLSDVVTYIASTLPPGTVIGDLSLSKSSLETPLSLSVRADNFDKGVILRKNFEDSGIFKDIVLSGISGGGEGSEDERYPYSISISATLVPSAIQQKVAEEEANQ